MTNQIKALIKEIVPDFLLREARLRLRGRKHYCPVCRNKVYRFQGMSEQYFEQWLKYRYIHSLFNFETTNIVAYACPLCGASDRDRLYAVFLAGYLEGKETRFLEIAPAKPLARYIRSFPGVKYRSADLHMPEADDKVDITDMAIYPDESFDFILCSHILEHIEDDSQALRELYRVLSRKGKGILMSPVNLGLEADYEIKGPLTEPERWHHYGQGDHVRTYSKKGFMEKIRNVGFLIEEVTAANYGQQVFERCGILEGSVLYVVSKE
ncbi:MAG: class I SAM-dependent methyltransferase [bacterium]|nr:class I SAM-dependent methyltransferase [bacterium]